MRMLAGARVAVLKSGAVLGQGIARIKDHDILGVVVAVKLGNAQSGEAELLIKEDEVDPRIIRSGEDYNCDYCLCLAAKR